MHWLWIVLGVLALLVIDDLTQRRHGMLYARAADDNFDHDRSIATVEAHDVRAIDIELSQGAKPGRGGLAHLDMLADRFGAAEDLVDFERLMQVSG